MSPLLYWVAFGFACAIVFAGVPLAHWLERRSDEADRRAWRRMGCGRL